MYYCDVEHQCCLLVRSESTDWVAIHSFHSQPPMTRALTGQHGQHHQSSPLPLLATLPPIAMPALPAPLPLPEPLHCHQASSQLQSHFTCLSPLLSHPSLYSYNSPPRFTFKSPIPTDLHSKYSRHTMFSRIKYSIQYQLSRMR